MPSVKGRPLRRTQAEVRAIRLATAADLGWLGERDPATALEHPRCRLVLWWALAARDPLEARQAGRLRLPD